jgi:hypothetical protein
MLVVKDVTPFARKGSVTGIPVQLASGALLCGAATVGGTRGIAKSTDGGKTWTIKQAFASGTVQSRCNFIDQQGNIYFSTEISNAQAILYRSTDDGENWTAVLTADSSALWRIAQQSNGVMYVNEYSIGASDANELYAYRILKSVDNGVTWTLFYTAPEQTSPGDKDGIRHIHGVWCDSNNRLYMGMGDPTFDEPATHAYELNADGTLGTLISDDDNGFTAMLEADDGSLLFGGDNSPNRIVIYDPDADALTVVYNPVTDMGGGIFNTAVLDMVKGSDGVIYALTNGQSGSKPSFLVASGDDGQSWCLLRYSKDLIGASYLTLNPNALHPRLFVGRSQGSSAVYISLPDFTRGEILTNRVVVR